MYRWFDCRAISLAAAWLCTGYLEAYVGWREEMRCDAIDRPIIRIVLLYFSCLPTPAAVEESGWPTDFQGGLCCTPRSMHS